MNARDFVRGVKMRAADAAVRNMLRDLREPLAGSPQAAQLAEWYSSLAADARERLQEIIRRTADRAIFGAFCILDGVRVIEDTPAKGEFELYFTSAREKTRLNSPSEPLHDLYRSIEE